jgi:hypothetical protein
MINDLHASHIRRIYVEFSIESPDLEPTLVTERLGIPPSQFGRRGDERRNYAVLITAQRRDCSRPAFAR